MKKLLPILIALCLLTGCQKAELPRGVIVDPNVPKAEAPILQQQPKQTESDTSAQEQPPATEQQAKEILCFTAPNGTPIQPLDRAEDILPLLGEAQSRFEADSCAYQGKDYYYYYPGFELTVNEIEGTLRISAITLADDTMKLAFEKGSLGIGDREETLLAVLGGEGSRGLYTYLSEGCRLQVEVQEGVITNMVFKPLAETAGVEE